MSRRVSGREWGAIVALLVLAFAMRTLDLTRVPPGLHNDEVVEIKLTESVSGGRYEIFYPEDTGHEPLYYYLSAPFTQLVGRNVFTMRLLTAFVSMLTMCVVWALSRRLLGAIVALAALAGFAILFWPVAFGRIISHVVMDVPLAALAAYSFWRGGETPGRKAWLWWALSGLWLGLAINAYTAARVLPAILIAFGLYVLVVDRDCWRSWWAGISIALVVTVVVASPLALYLLRNPGVDQLGFFEIDRPMVELRQGNLGPVFETLLRTLGMFAFVGDPLPYFDVPDRPVFGPFGAALLGIGLLLTVWRWRQPRYGFLLLWFIVALVPGMLSQPAPNYTRTLAAQVVVFAIPGIAVAALLKRWRHPLLYGALAVLLLGNLAWTVRDYFFVWPVIDTVRFWHQTGLKAVADQLESDEAASPVAICVPDHLIDEREPWWRPAWQHMRYLLDRPDLALRYYNCADTMLFIDGPARYAFPDVAEPGGLDAIPAYAEVLTAAKVEVERLPDGLGVIVRADQGNAPDRVAAVLKRRLESVQAISVVHWAPEAGNGELPARVPIGFQGVAQFRGYELSDPTPAPGEQVRLQTYWQVSADLPPQLTQFTHVLDSEGSIVTQQDRLALTSASLRAGDLFVERHDLTIPPDLVAGTYPLTLGLYVQTNGIRLEITQSGESMGDRLWLGSIRVTQ